MDPIVLVAYVGVLMAKIMLLLVCGAIIVSYYNIFIVDNQRFVTPFTLANLIYKQF